MALKIEVPYSKSVDSKKSREETLKFLTNFETAVPKHFPGLESFTKQPDGSYHWKFQKVKYGAYEMQIQVLTRFEVGPNEIRMISIPKGGFSTLEGGWKIADKEAGSEVTFAVDLSVELPIPFFLKGMATPIAQKELGKIFDRYLDNVGKAIS